MTTIEKSCEMLASVDRVWALISDTDRDESYWGAIRDVKVLKKEGNTIEREAMVGPKAFSHKSHQIIVFDPKKTIELSMTGTTMDGGRTIRFVPTGPKSTRVDVVWDLKLKDVPGFVQTIVKGQISKATV
ncbi:MAG: type II toxin-antitoxin system RatA family toxin, partial [Nitrososphaerales archaeon]